MLEMRDVDHRTEDLEALAVEARASYRTIEDTVHHMVAEAIIRGLYAPGERLAQDRIAETLGVSRIPVRAALRRLEAEGLVSFQPHRGATVRELSPKEVAEIYDLRILLETYALRLAASRITPEQLDHLEELAIRIDQTTDADEWVRCRADFYSELYLVADCPLTVELILKLRADVGRYWLVRRFHEGLHARGAMVIVEALRHGDPIEAERWLQAHLSTVSKELQRLIEDESPSRS
jgi:DNA-binding GntR family transcriptional regulator